VRRPPSPSPTAFRPLHAGHLRYLQVPRPKRILIVAVNADVTAGVKDRDGRS
jgi:bifunctional ADP-heptose synthase (sugar kinase/adenylyltransferase)